MNNVKFKINFCIIDMIMKDIIYQIFVRNYSKEGTIKAVTDDLDRLFDLGVNILYLMPIHEIGVLNRKGTYGSPYSIKDYFSISKDLGTLDDFKELILRAHTLNMKVIMDMVFNHTSRDNPLLKKHPEYYYYKDEKPANKIGDWSDVIDLETSREDTQKYLLSVIKYWSDLGVDGYRFDVASLIPLNFFKKVREMLPNAYLLAESIDPDFVTYARSLGFNVASDKELGQYFDTLYCYNYYRYLEHFYKYDKPLSKVVEALNNDNVKRVASLENHDTDRLLELVKNDDTRFYTLTRFLFTLNATPFIYDGMEIKTNHRPELFEKDPINWKKFDKETYSLYKELIQNKLEEKEIKKQAFELVNNREIKVITTYIDNKKKEEVFHF